MSSVGFWLSRVATALEEQVVYVSREVPNLGCDATKPGSNAYTLLQPPDPNASSLVVMHDVKAVAAHSYLWSVLHDGKEHSQKRCLASLSRRSEYPSNARAA